MPLTSIAIYAPGDTITSAWANILRTNFGVLDSRTGGDPATAGKMLVSDGATSAAWVAQLTAVIGALGYTPANNAGTAFSGHVTVPSIAVAGTVSADDLSLTGDIAAAGSIVATGGANFGNYAGGSDAVGSPAVLGLTVGTGGIGVNGSVVATGGINGGNYGGGSTTVGTASFLGLTVGATGVTILGQQVYHPGNPPPAGVSVPSGLVALVRTAAEIPSGWSRETNLDGRMAVGAGTTFSVTYTEATDYGSAWSHAHTGCSFSASVSGSAVGGPGDTTGNNSAAGQSAGTGTSRADDPHNHSLNGVSLAVSASGTATGDTSSASWVIPSRAYVYVRKT